MLSETVRPPDAQASAELNGLVDNAANDRLYGWVWNAAAPQERVAVELRLGSATVFRTQADFARPDLAKAGIGDGCHAFEIPLEPDWIRRRTELSVVARAEDGTEFSMPIRVRRPPAEAAPAEGQRTLEVLVASHRRIQEELRAIGARQPEVTSFDELLRTQKGLAEQLETLMLWLARLDERLAVLPLAAPRPTRRRRDRWTMVLGLLLALIGAGALVLAVWLEGR
ncbi:hypothetical protein GXW78_11165 [Roseomonas terrae]|uniref:Uncharacterized protein n=1 Tax=Neoroseomonas terrae TaxID=424799 RepID=A0ABS5EGS1_9PROT|nr:hypothetical protein [Neoroseomonas terrae]MBR0650224.1 hypothetical protein [Neoroseomonas terrae]